MSRAAIVSTVTLAGILFSLLVHGSSNLSVIQPMAIAVAIVFHVEEDTSLTRFYLYSLLMSFFYGFLFQQNWGIIILATLLTNIGKELWQRTVWGTRYLLLINVLVFFSIFSLLLLEMYIFSELARFTMIVSVNALIAIACIVLFRRLLKKETHRYRLK